MDAIRFPTLDLSNEKIREGCRDGPPNDNESRDWKVIYTQHGYRGPNNH